MLSNSTKEYYRALSRRALKRRSAKNLENCTWCSGINKQDRVIRKDQGLSFEEHELISAIKQYADILDGLNGLYSLITKEPLALCTILGEEIPEVPISDLESTVSSGEFKSLVYCTECSLRIYLDIAKSQSLFERTVLHSNIAKEILAYLHKKDFSDAIPKLEEFYKAVKRNGYLAF